MFVPNQNFDAAIAVEAPGNVFAVGTEPWLGLAGALDCLRVCSLSPGQANRWITGQIFDYMISFTEIIPDKVQGIGKIIMATTTAALSSNQPYKIFNNIKAWVHWCRENLDTEEDSQPETSMNKPDKFKPINWVQWSKNFDNCIAQYRTARKAVVLLS